MSVLGKVCVWSGCVYMYVKLCVVVTAEGEGVWLKGVDAREGSVMDVCGVNGGAKV